MKKRQGIIFIILIVLAATLFIFIYRYSRSTYVAKISGVSVTEAEYKLYLYEQKIRIEKVGDGEEIWKVDLGNNISLEDSAKESALKSIELIKLSVIEAEKRGIKLSEEEIETSKQSKIELISNTPKEVLNKIGLDDKELRTIMLENQIYNMLFSDITKNVEVLEKDFKEYKDKTLLESYGELMEIYINYIFVANNDNPENSYNKSLEILKLANQENDFDNLILEYSDDKDGLEPKLVNDDNFPKEVIEVAYRLDENKISDLIYIEDGYYIIKVKSKSQEDAEEVEKIIRDKYIMDKKQEVFNAEYKKWRDESTIKINKELYDSISISDL